MEIVGNAESSRYDVIKESWLVSDSAYRELKALEQKLFPAKVPAKQKMASIIKSETKQVDGADEMGADMKLQPYPYQKEVIKFALDAESALIVSPCGSGKTPMGIGLYLEAVKAGKIHGPGLIVVKASLKTQWAAEVRKFSHLRPKVLLTSKDASKNYASAIKRREKKLQSTKSLPEQKEIAAGIANLKREAQDAFESQFEGADLLIANYETLRDAKVRAALHRARVDFVFADEIHFAKSDTTERSKALCEFNDATIKAGATATPLQRDPRDLYGIFKFINPALFPKKGAFERMYIRWAGRGRVAGSKNEKQLNEEISPFMIIKTKEEVAKQLPSLVVTQRYCQFEPAQLEASNRLMEELDELHEQEKRLNERLSDAEAKNSPELQRIEAGILMRQTFAQELADSEELLGGSDSETAQRYLTGKSDNKVELLMEMLEEIIGSGEKVCVFSRFTKMQQVITAQIEKEAKKNPVFKGVRIAYVNGALSGERRFDEVYNKFRDQDEYKVLLCSDAGAEGLNLSTCKYMIEVEPAESYAIQTQRHGRLERADSIHDTVFVYQLICEDSWDEIGRKIIDKKERYDGQIVKGVEYEGDFV